MTPITLLFGKLTLVMLLVLLMLLLLGLLHDARLTKTAGSSLPPQPITRGTIMAAPITQVGAVTDGPDHAGDEFIAETLAAHTSGIPIEEYLHARAHGIGNTEVRDAHQHGYHIVEYAACRALGASQDELYQLTTHLSTNVLVISGGLVDVLRKYAQGQRLGVTHFEIMWALSSKGRLPSYIRCRRLGATHAEIREYTDRGGYLPLYDRARAMESGITHVELMAAQAQHPSVIDYVEARERGCTHTQALAHKHRILDETSAR
jgi:hypothetical protein